MESESTAVQSPPRADAGSRTRHGLRADLRATLPDFSVALLVTGSVFAFLYSRVRSGESATLAVMPFLADANTYWLYWLCQAFGWSALLWAWLTVMLGLLLAGPRPRWLPGYARLERLHRTTSLSTIALMFLHALFFAAESVRYEAALSWPSRLWGAFVDSFVPGGYATGTGQVAILIGLIAFYLAIPLGLLFYFRHRVGARAWRVLHRGILVVYVLSVWHTLLYGTNVWYAEWPRTVLWLLQIPVAALLLVRLQWPARRGERRRDRLVARSFRLVGRLAAVAVIVGVLAVVVTGRDGGRERPAPEPATSLADPAGPPGPPGPPAEPWSPHAHH